jgi:hypothetical protein
MNEYVGIAQVGEECIDSGKVGWDWFDQWNTYIHVAFNELAEGRTTTGSRFDATTQPFHEYRGVDADGHPLDTVLLVLQFGENVSFFVAGLSEQPDDGVAQAWSNAAREAVSRLGSPGPVIPWSAILGPDLDNNRVPGLVLDREYQVGPFTISSGKEFIREHYLPAAGPPQLFSASQANWWPMHVRASHQGYNWASSSRKAALDLHRLTCMLTLAMNLPLVVRSSPRPDEMGLLPVPTELFWQTWPGDNMLSVQTESFAPPDWLAPGWRELVRRPWLANAIAIYRESLLTRAAHPSLSLVAAVASIEAVAGKLFELKHCPECSTRLGLSASFRETLKLVLPADHADRLGRQYGPRSKTVHEGRLHGSEPLLGSTGFLWTDDRRDFEYQGVYALQNAARQLLLLAFENELPTKGPLPD